MQAMNQKRAQQMAAQQAGNQPQPESEMNGVRTGSPTEGEAVGSPSKRPRIENGQQQFNNAMMQNGRAGAIPAGAQQQMLMQSGFNPAMNPQQMRPNGAMPPKGVQVRKVSILVICANNAGSNAYHDDGKCRFSNDARYATSFPSRRSPNGIHGKKSRCYGRTTTHAR